MSFRHAIERVAVADARRFETRMLGLQRQILKQCEDSATQRVMQELIAEEEEHLKSLDGVAAVKISEGEGDLPELHGKTLREMVADILEMEKAAVGFYTMIAERTLIPSVRDVFQKIADAERGHEERLEALLREIEVRDSQA